MYYTLYVTAAAGLIPAEHADCGALLLLPRGAAEDSPGRGEYAHRLYKHSPGEELRCAGGCS